MNSVDTISTNSGFVLSFLPIKTSCPDCTSEISTLSSCRTTKTTTWSISTMLLQIKPVIMLCSTSEKDKFHPIKFKSLSMMSTRRLCTIFTTAFILIAQMVKLWASLMGMIPSWVEKYFSSTMLSISLKEQPWFTVTFWRFLQTIRPASDSEMRWLNKIFSQANSETTCH